MSSHLSVTDGLSAVWGGLLRVQIYGQCLQTAAHHLKQTLPRHEPAACVMTLHSKKVMAHASIHACTQTNHSSTVFFKKLALHRIYGRHFVDMETRPSITIQPNNNLDIVR